jgi:hypothetical protein
MNRGYNGGEQRAREVHVVKGDMVSSPLPEGLGAFIDCRNGGLNWLGCSIFLCGGWCGLISLHPAPSYGLQPSDKGTWLPVRCHLVPSCSMYGGALLGAAKPPDLDICGGIDRLGTCVIEFYTESIGFTRICLPYAGIITVCMCVSLVEMSCQTVKGWIVALECMMSRVCGLLQPLPIWSCSECSRPPRSWCCPCLSGSESPWEGWLDAWVPLRSG